MASSLSLSGKNQDLPFIGLHHSDLESSIRLYYSNLSPNFPTRFFGYNPGEISAELGERLEEIEITSSLAILASIEAAFRIDYYYRCKRKNKDDVSLEFRSVYKRKALRVSLEDEIFEIWKVKSNVSASLIGDLRGAFKFRHWIAHGRYWKPKLGQKFDFSTVFLVGQTTFSSFPLILS